jgi:hypothetical protein
MNDVKKATYSSWGSVEMTCTRLSPLFVLYVGVVPTTSNSKKLSQYTLLYTLSQQVMSPDSAAKTS